MLPKVHTQCRRLPPSRHAGGLQTHIHVIYHVDNINNSRTIALYTTMDSDLPNFIS